MAVGVLPPRPHDLAGRCDLDGAKKNAPEVIQGASTAVSNGGWSDHAHLASDGLIKIVARDIGAGKTLGRGQEPRVVFPAAPDGAKMEVADEAPRGYEPRTSLATEAGEPTLDGIMPTQAGDWAAFDGFVAVSVPLLDYSKSPLLATIAAELVKAIGRVGVPTVCIERQSNSSLQIQTVVFWPTVPLLRALPNPR